VVGRYACDVRICSCPGRDIRAEEGKAEKNHLNEHNGNETDSSNLVTIELPAIAISKGKMKKRKAVGTPPPPLVGITDSIEDDDRIYNLNVDVTLLNTTSHNDQFIILIVYMQIKGLKNYNFIKDLISRLQHDYDGYPPGDNQTNHGEGKRFKKEQP
jgi:hypothetical protein